MVNNDSNIKSKKDLNKKTVAIQLGSSSEVALDSDKDFVKSLKELKNTQITLKHSWIYRQKELMPL